VLQAVVAAYLLAAAAMPFAHHDLACHIKSNTHCGTCHVGTSADPSDAAPSVVANDVEYAGKALDLDSAPLSEPALPPSAGRAPPAVR
jgi:hypothetical protein